LKTSAGSVGGRSSGTEHMNSLFDKYKLSEELFFEEFLLTVAAVAVILNIFTIFSKM
jgi:hypothetical protein